MRLFWPPAILFEDKDWSQHLGRLSTAKPHSGRGSATETVQHSLHCGSELARDELKGDAFILDARVIVDVHREQTRSYSNNQQYRLQFEKVAQCNGKNADC